MCALLNLYGSKFLYSYSPPVVEPDVSIAKKLNHQFVPSARRESCMVKLSQAHVSAICHAELFLEGAMEKVDSRKILMALEQDKLKLAELKLYIFTIMSQPKLPFGKEVNLGEVSG